MHHFSVPGRLADAMLRTGQPHKAVALLEPLFTRGKQIFTVNIMPILVSQSFKAESML